MQERMRNNNPPATEDHYHVVCNNDSHQGSNVVVQQIISVEGGKINMLTLRCKDDKWTRITNTRSDANKTPIEKHVTFKFDWDLESLANNKNEVLTRCSYHSEYFII
jgi:hypothetical protein